MMRPQNYRQWREEWRRCLYQIGYCCMSDGRERRCQRTLYRLRSRAERIHKRMEAEADAYGQSFGEAIVQLMKKWK